MVFQGSDKCIIAGCGEPIFGNGTCCKKHHGSGSGIEKKEEAKPE